MGIATRATGLVGLATALALGMGTSREAEAADKAGFQISIGIGHHGNGFQFSLNQPGWYQPYGGYAYPSYQPYGGYAQPYYQPYYPTYVPTYVPTYPSYGYGTWRPGWGHGHGRPWRPHHGSGRQGHHGRWHRR